MSPPEPQRVKIQDNPTHRSTEKGSASRATGTLNQKANCIFFTKSHSSWGTFQAELEGIGLRMETLIPA